MQEAFDLILRLPDDRRLPGLPVRHRHQLQRRHQLHRDGVRRARAGCDRRDHASASPTPGGLTDADVIRFMAERQEAEFERLGLSSERSGAGGSS